MHRLSAERGRWSPANRLASLFTQSLAPVSHVLRRPARGAAGLSAAAASRSTNPQALTTDAPSPALSCDLTAGPMEAFCFRLDDVSTEECLGPRNVVTVAGAVGLA
jgi:hypothetical protein